VALGAGGPVAACTTSNTATTYTPYTGIDVPTDTVIAGIGCATPDAAPGDGIDHYVAVLAYAADAGTMDEVQPSSIVAAGIFSCFTPTGTFENVDASASFDVWIFGFPAGVPANLPCDQGTCAVSGASAWSALSMDQDAAFLPGQAATVVLRCSAVAESGAHPSAYGCRRVDTGVPADSGTLDDAGDGSTSDGSPPGDASVSDASVSDAASGDAPAE
jgi:hypothetical protein